MSPSAAAESGDRPPAIATDPEVLAAERLFIAWIEGQIAYRGLPGVVVGALRATSSCGRRGLSTLTSPPATAIMQLREARKVLDFPTTEQLRALIGARHAAFAPQVRWKYSNLAYSVAGLVVESATGRRMPDGSREAFGFVDARVMAAATGITSTVEDMARFVSAQFRRGTRGGDRLLSSGSRREMHRVRSVEETWSGGNAIGVAVSRVGDKSYIGHGGSYPGYTTAPLLQLDGRVGVVVLTNAQDSEPGAIARELMTSVGAAVARRAALKAPSVTWWRPDR